MTPPEHKAARRIDWRWAALALLATAALLLAAFWHLREPPVTARPALWLISKGDRQAWLFGTIHAVPAGARWLSPAIAKAVDESDELVLEAAGLAEERGARSAFEDLGRSPNLPAVAARLSERDRAQLASFVAAHPDVLRNLDGYESWAAALLIGAAANQGISQDDAAEAVLEARFRKAGRPIIGLETIAAQLGSFDTLPEPDQRAMLAQAVAEAPDAPAEFAKLYTSWSTGNLKGLESQFLVPLQHHPGLRNALINRRNALWTRQIDALLRQDARRRFIAVGSGHLLGPESVQARLAALGWDVRRVQ